MAHRDVPNHDTRQTRADRSLRMRFDWSTPNYDRYTTGRLPNGRQFVLYIPHNQKLHGVPNQSIQLFAGMTELRPDPTSGNLNDPFDMELEEPEPPTTRLPIPTPKKPRRRKVVSTRNQRKK